MKEQFIPYELAVKLKELGFDEECFRVKLKNSPEHWYTQTDYEDYPEQKEEEVLIPLWQQAFEWLWNKTNKYIIPIPNDDKEWLCLGQKFKTYEEARQACLEKLIELCKKN